MKKVDKSSFAGTKAEQSTNADVNSVSQPIAKPNVSGIISGIITLAANVPPEFAKAVVDLYEQHNVGLVEISDLDDNWKRVVVTGQRGDLIKLNKECENVAYGDVSYFR